MDQSQARLILGNDLNLNSDSYEILDAIEESVFEEVTFFMRRSFLPTLATKCIKKLNEIDLAANTLGLHFDFAVKEYFVKEDLSYADDLLSLLSVYHSHESQLKSKLLNTTIPLQAVSLYDQWIILFESFALRYIKIFQNLNVDGSFVNKVDIRISEAIEFNDLYKELKVLKFNNLACREYYRLQKMVNK
ncbi:hypothetical protein G3O08_19920 [Cryomorpha ignava]|uniref:Uncharacterized protein n=1 Tax=Cryomorpha ignava TaxID=101383 RepID=A0A7K3WY20_9FLAO|nr:hypothetical protein [Cryomorpha ignava]NEN25762.1 hypothetical protein [Cryomorpha ignava]